MNFELDCDGISSASERVAHASLHDPVAQFVGCRGKRIRGSLMQLAYAMAGGTGDLPAVVVEAIEELHAGSLVVDDIQDNSELRRDQPTLHRQIGVPLAINAGNWMYFHALELLATSSLPDDQRCSMTTAMIRAGKICHQGQAIDLGARVDALRPADWAEVAESISVCKTGVLVGLAMELGATAAGADKTVTSSLVDAGREIGVALQMRNDLAELADCERYDDLRNARVTWPWAWYADRATAAACTGLASELAGCSKPQLRAVALELIDQVGDYGEVQIKQRVDQAIQRLGEVLPTGASDQSEMLSQLSTTLQPILGKPTTQKQTAHKPTAAC